MTTICWFRNDLRTADNPALAYAADHGLVVPVFILEPPERSVAIGDASRAWLEASIRQLNAALQNRLNVFVGDPVELLPQIAAASNADRIVWNRRYEPLAIETDKAVMATLKAKGLQVQSFKAGLLWEPWAALKKDGTPYRVFTPFYKHAVGQLPEPEAALEAPRSLEVAQALDGAHSINDLCLTDQRAWNQTVLAHWEPGEEGAKRRLQSFVEKGLDDYREGRDFPALRAVSRLSPHLHFGEISPRQVWNYLHANADASVNREHFLRELIWREFSNNLLYHFPTLPHQNLQTHFDGFPWMTSKDTLTAWQTGMTGYPIVDAGMRELWATGYMHNRVRMIVGSFLVKNLLLDWRLGERWFWDCLVDADQANNTASWQWVAGCGADAAPYFRIFNPVTQGEKFDVDGTYTRQWIPELSQLPDRYLFKPWECPPLVLAEAGVTLGNTYPYPIVELKPSRERALAAYQAMKENRSAQSESVRGA